MRIMDLPEGELQEFLLSGEPVGIIDVSDGQRSGKCLCLSVPFDDRFSCVRTARADNAYLAAERFDVTSSMSLVGFAVVDSLEKEIVSANSSFYTDALGYSWSEAGKAQVLPDAALEVANDRLKAMLSDWAGAHGDDLVSEYLSSGNRQRGDIGCLADKLFLSRHAPRGEHDAAFADAESALSVDPSRLHRVSDLVDWLERGDEFLNERIDELVSSRPESDSIAAQILTAREVAAAYKERYENPDAHDRRRIEVLQAISDLPSPHSLVWVDVARAGRSCSFQYAASDIRNGIYSDHSNLFVPEKIPSKMQRDKAVEEIGSTTMRRYDLGGVDDVCSIRYSRRTIFEIPEDEVAAKTATRAVAVDVFIMTGDARGRMVEDRGTYHADRRLMSDVTPTPADFIATPAMRLEVPVGATADSPTVKAQVCDAVRIAAIEQDLRLRAGDAFSYDGTASIIKTIDVYRNLYVADCADVFLPAACAAEGHEHTRSSLHDLGDDASRQANACANLFTASREVSR